MPILKFLWLAIRPASKLESVVGGNIPSDEIILDFRHEGDGYNKSIFPTNSQGTRNIYWKASDYQFQCRISISKQDNVYYVYLYPSDDCYLAN